MINPDYFIGLNYRQKLIFWHLYGLFDYRNILNNSNELRETYQKFQKKTKRNIPLFIICS